MRILVSAPHGEGHLGPVLLLATAVRDAGHEVLVVVDEGSAAAVRDRDLPLRRLPAPSDASRRAMVDTVRQVEAMMGQGQRDDADAIYVRESFGWFQCDTGLAAARSEVAAFRPDLVLTDPFQAAVTAAAVMAEVPLALVPFAAHAPLHGMLRLVAEGAERVTQAHGLTAERLVAAWEGAPHFSPLPARLDPGSDDSVIRWRRATPAVGDEVDDELWQLVGDEERAVVYATLGTVAGTIPPMRDRFVGALLPAVADLDVRCVLTVGRDTDLDALPPRPPNVTVAPFLPQRSLLALSDIAVSHGGLNTVLDIGAAALPHVVVPLHAGDGYWNAANVEACGAGRGLVGPDVTPEGVRTALTTLLASDEAADAAAALAGEIAALPSSAAVVTHLEALVG